MCECVCVLAKEGEGDGDEEKDRNKDPSVSTEYESLPFLSQSQGTRARDNSLVAVFFVRNGVTPVNNNSTYKDRYFLQSHVSEGLCLN